MGVDILPSIAGD